MNQLKVFMVMPFSDKVANSNYLHSIKPVCEAFNLEVRRADEIFGTTPIYDDVLKEIQDASIIIVDITSKNANVFYELGMAHTLKQSRTIIVTQDGFTDLPFDIAHFRIIHYANTIDSKVKFENQLKSTLENLLSDRKETFKDEFQIVFDIFTSSEKAAILFGLIGLKKYKGTLSHDEYLYMEGTYKEQQSSNTSVSISNFFSPMEKLGYVAYENSLIKLTEKGSALTDFVSERGVECFQFNDQVFSKDFVPLFEKMSRHKIQE